MLTILWNQVAVTPGGDAPGAAAPQATAPKFSDLKLERLQREDAEVLEVIATWVQHSELWEH
jgi:hypothetical protein